MKIKCDVCEKEEATVFCASDEAALCKACDNVVHLANKLVTKHIRFPLLTTSFKDAAPTLCDICQERKAMVFCREDRALFCIQCNTSIHEANVNTRNHSRFLLTGVEIISSVSKSCSIPNTTSYGTSTDLASSSICCSTSEMSKQSCCNIIMPTNYSSAMLNSTTSEANTSWRSSYCNNYSNNQENLQDMGSSSPSSFLAHNPTETLAAGWPFEDFLDPSCSTYESLLL